MKLTEDRGALVLADDHVAAQIELGKKKPVDPEPRTEGSLPDAWITCHIHAGNDRLAITLIQDFERWKQMQSLEQLQVPLNEPDVTELAARRVQHVGLGEQNDRLQHACSAEQTVCTTQRPILLERNAISARAGDEAARS